MAISLGILTQHFQTNPSGETIVKFAGRNVDFSPGGSVRTVWLYSKHTVGPQVNQHRSGKSAMLGKPWIFRSCKISSVRFRTSLVNKNSFGCVDMVGLQIVWYHAHGRRPPRLLWYVSELAGKAALEARNSHRGQIGSSSHFENGENIKFMFQTTNQ